MCGGGGSPAPAPPVDTYRGPPGPGMDIGNVPLGQPNYQQQAQSLLSIGQTYGQMASGIAGMLDAQRRQTEAQFMAPPPAPASAFDSGIGQYIGQRAARPMGQSAPMAAIESFEAAYDPRSSAIQILESYEPGTEARPLSYYTPESMAAMEEAATDDAVAEDPARPGFFERDSMGQLIPRSNFG